MAGTGPGWIGCIMPGCDHAEAIKMAIAHVPIRYFAIFIVANRNFPDIPTRNRVVDGKQMIFMRRFVCRGDLTHFDDGARADAPSDDVQ